MVPAGVNKSSFNPPEGQSALSQTLSSKLPEVREEPGTGASHASHASPASHSIHASHLLSVSHFVFFIFPS